MLDGDEYIENWHEFVLDMIDSWMASEEQGENKPRNK